MPAAPAREIVKAVCGDSLPELRTLLAASPPSAADAKSESGFPSVYIALQLGHTEVMRELLAHGANVGATAAQGDTALHIAAQAGQGAALRLLLDGAGAAAAINARTDDGRTALFIAAMEGHADCVRALLAAGADASPDCQGYSALSIAEQQGHEEIVSLLREPPAVQPAAAPVQPPVQRRRPASRGWLERCCSSRCTPGPVGKWATMDDMLQAAASADEPRGSGGPSSRGGGTQRYRALFSSPRGAGVEAESDTDDVARRCGLPLLTFRCGDLLEETGSVPAAFAQDWALGTCIAKAGSRDDDDDESAGAGSRRRGGEEPAAAGLFPLQYAAPVLAEPRLHRAIHRFKQSAAAADRGELWFEQGENILVTAMAADDADSQGANALPGGSWAYGHLVKGARSGAAGLLPLAYLAAPTRRGAMDAAPSPQGHSPSSTSAPELAAAGPWAQQHHQQQSRRSLAD